MVLGPGSLDLVNSVLQDNSGVQCGALQVFGLDVLMVLAENEGREIQLIELPDGTIALDTCMDCYTRMGFSYSQALN